jgi:ABC-type polysaccharide/polyol phosphate transport system ATPase subunit
MTGAPTQPRGSISVEHLWKRFRADRNRPVLRDEIGRLGDAIRGRLDGSRWRWALRDVTLEIQPGEAVGLFGANGSGKSTLLKMLTRVMYPTVGRLAIAGRVGALIEVKAGVHPDLTGRENIYLYGSIMGLRRQEIDRRFDEIVDFAELDDALDRQLKYYSSGMGMRLGFAVAAFLQPDILLVDEVLAVGDATFQQKCLDRMRAVLREGTTLVFVSHDLASIESISQRGVWLRAGVVRADGPIRDSLAAYRQHIESSAHRAELGDARLGATVDLAGDAGAAPTTGGTLRVDVTLVSPGEQRAVLFLGVSEGSAAPIFSIRREVRLAAGTSTYSCTVSHLPLPRGRYFVWMAATDSSGTDLIPWHPARDFDVLGPELEPALPGVMRLSPVHVGAEWEQVASGAVPVRSIGAC